MNWQEIKVSSDNTHFLYNGKPLFDKRFMEVLKFHEPGLAPLCDETGWYHINANGTPIYKERYKRAFGYYFNRAGVTDNSGCFHIDESGKKAYNEKYAWVGNFQENLCTVKDFVRKFFHIDLAGNKIYLEFYVYAGDYKDGFACVKTNKGWKHIDRTGKELNGKLFLDLGIFHKGIATAKDPQGWFHINKKGNPLYNRERFLYVEPFYNGVSIVTRKNGQKALINEDGIIIQEFI